MYKFISIVLFSVLLNSCGHSQKHDKHHRFDDAKKWSRIFEDPKRDSWQTPQLIFNELDFSKTMKIADIGAATGYFPVRLAKQVPNGRVWGIDIEPNLVKYLNERAWKENIPNLFSTLGTFTDPMIPEVVDYIFVVDTYHHFSDRLTYLRNLKKYLSKNGKIVIIDFKKGKLPFGPKDKVKMSPDEVKSELKEAGYKLIKEPNILKYQYMLVFQED